MEAGASSASADPDAKALTVRASTAIREVVANVEIEDGQGIDLRRAATAAPRMVSLPQLALPHLVLLS